MVFKKTGGSLINKKHMVFVLFYRSPSKLIQRLSYLQDTEAVMLERHGQLQSRSVCILLKL